MTVVVWQKGSMFPTVPVRAQQIGLAASAIFIVGLRKGRMSHTIRAVGEAGIAAKQGSKDASKDATLTAYWMP